MAEFTVRSLVKRIDSAEIELRELRTGSGYFDEDERRSRMRHIRRWLKEDRKRLYALLGARQPEVIRNDQ